jgi:hypothetical protein
VTFARLWAFLAVALPTLAALLATLSTVDLAYQIRAGELMLQSGAVLRTDSFTFTAAGAPWLDQQWAAQVIFALVQRAGGWAGQAILRAVLVGATMALVYLACRREGVGRRVAAWLTLAGFLVAAVALGLRPQLFGMVLFAATLAILAGRREGPRALWLLPVIALAWANLHGSFFLAPLAIGAAWLEDVVSRAPGARRLAIIGVVTFAATFVGPFGVGVWTYALGLAADPTIRRIVSEWQPTAPLSADGALLYGSAIGVVAVVVLVARRLERREGSHRAVVAPWPRRAWLAGLLVLAAIAQRGIAWWALAAPVSVAALIARLGPAVERDEPRRRLNLVVVGVLVLGGLVLLPTWRPSDPLTGPAGLLTDAPGGIARQLATIATPDDRTWNAQEWGSWLEYAAPAARLAVDSRIEVIPADVWDDALAIDAGRSDWSAILDRRGVTIVVASKIEQAALLPLIRASASWRPVYEDADGSIFVRAGRPTP